MKTKIALACLMALVLAATAAAQTKISGTAQCGKPETHHAIDVGDRPNHALEITKVACTWTKPFEIAGSQTKEGSDVFFDDVNGKNAQTRGYHMSTMVSGDKFYVRYQGTATRKEGMPQSADGTWYFTGGTGKLKGLRGNGTYKGQANPDGTITYEVQGKYQLPK